MHLNFKSNDNMNGQHRIAHSSFIIRKERPIMSNEEQLKSGTLKLKLKEYIKPHNDIRTYFKTTNKETVIGCLIYLILMASYYIVYRLTGEGNSCYMFEHFHIYCPGCGGTRAITALLNLDIITASRNNLLLILYLPVIAVITMRLLTDRLNYSKFGIITLIITTVLFTVIRNIDYFWWLQPIS